MISLILFCDPSVGKHCESEVSGLNQRNKNKTSVESYAVSVRVLHFLKTKKGFPCSTAFVSLLVNKNAPYKTLFMTYFK